MKNTKRAPKPSLPKFTLADRLLAAGQRLRADETLVARTQQMVIAAKFIQAGAR